MNERRGALLLASGIHQVFADVLIVLEFEDRGGRSVTGIDLTTLLIVFWSAYVPTRVVTEYIFAVTV